ncbi:fibrillin-1-like [Haliotis rubra]|uniref:fibrillin-1-like n=1 Tax=Haliotis rubra TaxID=36100 RepID=UPI001EE5FD04|nr:fibrillin-1-like [Haliotis rubra]
MVTIPAIVVLLGLLALTNGQINCGEQRVDLSIILDESSSVGANNFIIAKQFVADVVSGANISTDAVQVSVITFSTSSAIDINFDDYSNDAAGLQTAITGLVYARGGGTNTAEALNLAADTVFSANRRGERPDARNVVIVVTDGMASNANLLLQRAITNIQNEAEVFSVGVGNEVSVSELGSIASSPGAEHVYEVATFDALMCITDSIFTSLCPPCVVDCTINQICDRPANVCIIPVNECADNTHNCDANAVCQDTPSSFECMCNPPLVGDGTVGNCNDPDPCTLNADNCDGNATCTPTASGFNCTCNTGFIGTGAEGECVVDPCLGNDCDGNATCTPLENGGFNCDCNAGFVGNGRVCDVDPCASNSTNNCDAAATCTATASAFSCTCNDGFFGNGTMDNCMVCP